jgi:hypothetical protein
VHTYWLYHRLPIAASMVDDHANFANRLQASSMSASVLA